MAKFRDFFKSIVAEVLFDNNYATLDACLESLANNNIKLCEESKLSDEIAPLTEAQIRGMNLDLGTIYLCEDTLEQCLDKFATQGLVKYEGPSSVLNLAEEYLYKTLETPKHLGHEL